MQIRNYAKWLINKPHKNSSPANAGRFLSVLFNSTKLTPTPPRTEFSSFPRSSVGTHIYYGIWD